VRSEDEKDLLLKRLKIAEKVIYEVSREFHLTPDQRAAIIERWVFGGE